MRNDEKCPFLETSVNYESAEMMQSVERKMAYLNVTDYGDLPPPNFLAVSGGGDDGAALPVSTRRCGKECWRRNQTRATRMCDSQGSQQLRLGSGREASDQNICASHLDDYFL